MVWNVEWQGKERNELWKNFNVIDYIYVFKTEFQKKSFALYRRGYEFICQLFPYRTLPVCREDPFRSPAERTILFWLFFLIIFLRSANSTAISMFPFYRLNAIFTLKREPHCVNALTVFRDFNIKNLILMDNFFLNKQIILNLLI
jgi:hypothetical protein